MFGEKAGPSFSVLVSSIALLALLLAPTAGAEGLPEVEFLSDGGLISGIHEVEVRVTGDLAEGEVYYYVDVGPEIRMEDLQDGTYSALIDADLLAEGPHTLYVLAYNSTGARTTATQDVDVDRNSPEVHITSTGGLAGGDFLVTGTAKDPYLNESAVYCVVDDDIEAGRSNVMTRVDDHFEFTIDTTQYEDGDHFVRIWAYDLWGSSNKSQGIGMDVDNTAPEVAITSTDGPVSANYTLVADIEDDHIDHDQVWIVIDGDEANASDHPMGFTGDRWEGVVDTALLEDGTHQLSIWAADTLGNTNVSGPIDIDVDNMPPSVELLSEAGTQSGTYTLRIRVIDPHLESVHVSVGGGTPEEMTGSDDVWTHDIDTTALDDGEVEIDIEVSDSLGNPSFYIFKINVANKPDMEIVNAAWDRFSVTEGDTVGVTVSVRNGGSVDAVGFKVAIVDGADIIASFEVTTPLAPGKIEDYVVEWKAEDPGTRRLSIQVDPEDAVAESEEANNVWPLNTDVTVKERESPGPGAALALLGLLGVGVYLRHRRA